MIQLADYFMGRDVRYAAELTPILRESAVDTVMTCNQLLQEFGEARKVNSGWRPRSINAATPGASKTSLHIICKACDLSDSDEALDDWCLEHPDVLERLGLWQESPRSTLGWCHVQIVPPRSGRRVFSP